MLGFMRRFDPGYVALKASLASGDVGEVLVVHNIHRNAYAAYGLDTTLSINNSAVHEVDISRWLLDEDYAWVQVLSGKPGPDVPDGQQDPLLITFRTTSGVMVTIEMFMTARYGYEVRCSVVAGNGILDMGDGTFVTRTSQGSRGQDIPELWLGRFGEAYRAEMQAWIDGIRGLTGACFRVISVASLGTFANSNGPSTKGYVYSLNLIFVVCPLGSIDTILPSENIQEEFFLSNFAESAFRICCISSLE